MPFRVPPSRIAQALKYLQGLKSGVGEFVGGVGSNLADRARAAGGLAYEALTSDPNIGRMTTAEFSQAAADRAPTPRLDQAAQDIGTIGRAIVTQPVETGKAIVGGEIDRFKGAFANPQALGEYTGSLIDPTRLAAALRHRIPISELDVYHGTPHTYAPTEANPLGEFDASKIGTGEGAQMYGHGIYLAEKPDVAKGYRENLTRTKPGTMIVDGVTAKPGPEAWAAAALHSAKGDANAVLSAIPKMAVDPTMEAWQQRIEAVKRLANKKIDYEESGSLYKADLPDEMIDRMLDWDKPLSEQPAAVREALMPIVKAAMKKRGTPDRALEYSANRAIGGDIVKDLLVGNGVTRADVSRIMQEAGIPGIKYLDAGSRGQGGSGTRNFVVFPGEEKKVRILERNGQPAPERIAQALEAAPQGGKVVGIRSRQTAKMADRINEALGGGPQPLSDNVQREMKLATSVLQSKNPQAVEDWIRAYYDADLPMKQFEAATTNLRKTLPPETVDALIQNAGVFGTADQFKAFLNATPAERAKQLAKVSK